MIEAVCRENWFIRLSTTRWSDLRGRKNWGRKEMIDFGLIVFEALISLNCLGKMQGRSETSFRPNLMRIGLFDSER